MGFCGCSFVKKEPKWTLRDDRTCLND